ncbi:MFS transporter [Kutzneria viridogrisea]|uniref:MFS family arabinose efflux permease n=1 Tax=Kutzneria viridogrisea TaxID=47990 RepID=A0ABR6BPW5_9PSEU|nr:putative MFS family arabinose efflux permease [Kutzneria viridogrisea]
MIRSWFAVSAVAIGTFSVVTSEMVPVGLLPVIGADLGAAEGTTGLTVTVPGLVAALGAPAVAVLIGRWDRRHVLCALMALLAAANLLSALAPALPLLLAARVLVGLCIGGFWTIAAGLGARLVPERSAGLATSLVFSGIAAASVLGVPAGTLVGQFAGWRAAFLAVGVLALVVLAALLVLLPPLPGGGSVRLTGARRLRIPLVVTMLLVPGHFAAYTYVRPLLEQRSGVAADSISVLLLVYGVAGICGTFLAGALTRRSARGTVLGLSALIAAVLALLVLFGAGQPAAIGLLVLWGLGYGGVSVSLQTWLHTVAPDMPETGSALFTAAFNLAIALGALAGGTVLDGLGPVAVLVLGCALTALAALVSANPTRESRSGARESRSAVG